MVETRSSELRARDGCGQERTAAAERCSDARTAREAYEAALEHGRGLRRRLRAARHSLEEAAAAADARHRKDAKDRAQAEYQAEHAMAEDEAARAEAAARWGRAVDAINREARVAMRAQGQASQAVAELESELRTAETHEHSLHVIAEAAEAACLEARVRLAACEERALAPQVAAMRAPVGPPTVGVPEGAPVVAAPPVMAGPFLAPSLAIAGPGAVPANVPMPRTAASSRTGPASSPDAPPQQGPGRYPRIGTTPTLIEALLGGDRRWLERAASLVAETVGRPAPEVFAQLRELVEAFVATAGTRGYVMLDTAHDFWARLTADECRDVLAALARLGFRYEPTEGWHADRAPVHSDLSMALAYAGLDARSLRRLPTNSDLRELPKSISADARALLMSEAPDLVLDQVVRMLGHRADSLDALWDDWGYVRPILLSDPRALL